MRSFSDDCLSRSWMLVVIKLNDSASLTQLIPRSNLHPVAEVALAHVLGALAERVHRARNRSGKYEANEDCGNLDHEKKAREKRHRREKHRAEIGATRAELKRPRSDAGVKAIERETELHKCELGLLRMGVIEASRWQERPPWER